MRRARCGSATARYLLWSDIPNNRIMRWDEETGAVSVFRKPSNFANGNTRDRQGRLLTCEHGARRVTRTEYDGTITIVADRFEGKPLNSPNDIVCKSDGSIWFTDPPFGILGYYEGYIAKPELPTNVYRVDGTTGELTRGRRRHQPAERPRASRPTSRSSTSSRSRVTPRDILAYDVVDGGTRLANKRTLIDAGPGHAGRLPRATWTATSGAAGAWARTGLDGVPIFNPDGKLIGRIDLPERCANLCFGGTHRNRLFMAGEHVALLALRQHAGRRRRLNGRPS